MTRTTCSLFLAAICPAVFLGAEPAAVLAQGRPASPPRVLVVSHATVVDVATGALLPDQRLVIRGDTIVAVEVRLRALRHGHAASSLIVLLRDLRTPAAR